MSSKHLSAYVGPASPKHITKTSVFIFLVFWGSGQMSSKHLSAYVGPTSPKNVDMSTRLQS